MNSTLLVALLISQTAPPSPATIEGALYLIAAAAAAWLTDKAWWHTKRIKAKRDDSNEGAPMWQMGKQLDKVVAHQAHQSQVLERQSEVLGLMSDNQARHIEATRTLQTRLDAVERKVEETKQQAILNGRDLEHLKSR